MALKKKYYYFLMIIFLFEPNIFVKYTLINNVFIVGAVLSFVTIALISIKNKVTLKEPIIYVIIWRVIALVTTICNHGDILKCGYQSMILIALLLYAEWFYETKELDAFLKQLYIIFTAYLLVNLVGYIFFLENLYAKVGMQFLGIKTRFTEYAFAAALLAITCYKSKEISKNYLIFTLSISLLNVVLPKISTAYMGILVIIVAYWFLSKVELRTEKFSSNHIIIWGSLILTLLIVVFRIQNIFSFIIVEVLHKDLSLTLRTYIWDNAFLVLKNSNWIIGNGYINDGGFVPYLDMIWQSHNQLIQLIYEVGIVGSYFFYRFISLCIYQIKQKSKYTRLVLAFAISILIMMITEILSYYLPTFVIFIIVYYSDVFNNLEEYKEKVKND